MSAKVREAISAAANTVAGVNVTPYFRQVTRPGQGMVRRDRTEYPNKFGGVVTWQVFVLLPQDIAQAERWLDENGSVLRAAVAEELLEGTVSMAPQQLALDAGAVPVVVIEGQREEE